MGTVAAITAIQCLAQSTYEPYTFTTLAGGGGFDSPEKPGTSVCFAFPALAADGMGNLYVAEQGNHIIRKITLDGVVTVLAGRPGTPGTADGTGSAARFGGPSAAAVDHMGNVYVADTFNSTIRKVTPEGEATTLAGSPGNAGSADGIGHAARFNAPFGMGVDKLGNVYVGDSDNHTIRKLTQVGTNWVVTTIAGRAGQFGVVDGSGGVARFNFPGPLVADGAGNLYVADGFGHTIRKLTPTGTNWVVSTIAGRAGVRGTADGAGSAARFDEPGIAAIDSAGNLFVADFRSHIVRKLTPSGTDWVVTTVAGLGGSAGSANGTNSTARFNIPSGAAIDSAGNLYVSDGFNRLIRKMTLTGTNWVVTTFAGFGGRFGSEDGEGTNARFFGPEGVAVDSRGALYVTDNVNHTVRSISQGRGIVTTLAGEAGHAGSVNGTNEAARLNAPSGIAVDKTGTVYVVDTANHTIRKIRPDPSGWVVTTLAGSPDPEGPGGNGGSADGIGSAARFSFPKGLAMDSAGNLYVADSNNSTIRRVTPAGVVTTRAGSPERYGSNDGTGTAARFNQPLGVAVDNATNIYVTDTYNHTIRKISPARVVTTLAGQAGSPGNADGIGSDARFEFPSSIAVDSTGNLYVADTYNNTIRKLKQAGTNWVVTTVGGRSGFYGTADGRGRFSRFSNPSGIAVDANGDLYVADSYFNTIRKGYAPPRLNPSLQGGQFQIRLATPPGESLTVIMESSPDLLNWAPVWTNTGTATFFDSSPGASPKRFYRATLPQ